MAVTATLHPSAVFPAGTTVEAYPVTNWHYNQRFSPSGSPLGSAAATATMESDGSLTFTGLTDDTDYFAVADVGGAYRYVRFRTDPLVEDMATQDELDAAAALKQDAATAATDAELADAVAAHKATLALNVKDYGAAGDGAADDTAEIQAALDAADTAGGADVYVPGGTYLISTALTVGSDTTLRLSPNATVKRNAGINNMLRNKGDGTTGGYGQASNITISGGTWDANMAGFASNCCAFAFGHCEDVTLRDLTIKNVHGWHHAELSSVRRGRVLHVDFLDFDAVTANKEMLQLDLSGSSGAFPWFGPYDSTPCDDILVDGCTFKNGCRGIGSHAATPGSPHTNVKITGCHFEDMTEEAVYGYDYDYCTVANNTVTDCPSGIVFTATTTGGARTGLVIEGNVVRATSSGRGIRVISNNSSHRYTGVLIRGNVVTAGFYGITFDNSHDVVVQGNRVSGCARSGVWLWGAGAGATKHVVVSGNDLRDNNTSATAGHADLLVGVGAIDRVTDVAVSGNVVGTCVIDYADNVVVAGNRFVTSYTDNARGGTVTRAATDADLAARPRVLAQSAVGETPHTGTTDETTIKTVTVPANAMGPNGRIRVTCQWSYSNNANNKSLIVKFGGASGETYQSRVVTSSLTVRTQAEWANRGVTNSQIGTRGSAGDGTSGSAAMTGSRDTTVAQDIVIRATLANAADSVTLESWAVELLPGA